MRFASISLDSPNDEQAFFKCTISISVFLAHLRALFNCKVFGPMSATQATQIHLSYGVHRSQVKRRKWIMQTADERCGLWQYTCACVCESLCLNALLLLNMNRVWTLIISFVWLSVTWCFWTVSRFVRLSLQKFTNENCYIFFRFPCVFATIGVPHTNCLQSTTVFIEMFLQWIVCVSCVQSKLIGCIPNVIWSLPICSLVE